MAQLKGTKLNGETIHNSRSANLDPHTATSYTSGDVKHTAIDP